VTKLTLSLFDDLDFQLDRVFPDLQVLDRADYNVNIKGSDRIYYQRYPYKVGLIDTSVSYSVHRALEMLDWWEMIGREHVKFVSNLTRHYYFKDKRHLDFFIDMFADQIKEVKGPVSEDHIGFLLEVNQNTIDNKRHRHYYGHVELVIRNSPWHNVHDLKVEIGSTKPTQIHSQANHHLTVAGVEKYNLLKAVKETCKGVVDKYRDSRWNHFYCSSEYIDDINMFVKIKHTDARLHISKALVEKNL
jgi:hypothetical protein